MVKVQDTVPAPLNYAPPGYQPFPEVDLHLGQPPGLPRRARRAGAQAGRHPEHRRHRDQGRLPRRLQPDVLCRRAAASRRSRLVDVDLRMHVARHPRRCAPARAWATSARRSRRTPRSTASPWCASSAATASAASFHEEPQVLHYGRAGAGLALEPGMTFTIEPMINAGKAGDPRAGRRLDHRHQGPQPVGAVGAHRGW